MSTTKNLPCTSHHTSKERELNPIIAMHSTPAFAVYAPPAPTRATLNPACCAAKVSRRQILLSATGAAIATLLAPRAVSAGDKAAVTALAGLVRVRDGLAELEAGTGGGDVARAVRLLVRGSDLRADSEAAARSLRNTERSQVVLSRAQEAREMLDLATQYYDSLGKRGMNPAQTRFAAEALEKARVALNDALDVFDTDDVREAQNLLAGPV